VAFFWGTAYYDQLVSVYDLFSDSSVIIDTWQVFWHTFLTRGIVLGEWVTNKTPKVYVAWNLKLYKLGGRAIDISSGTLACRPNLLKCLGSFLDIMVRHFNEGIYRRVITIWRICSKQKVIAQALGIAQGTVSKVLKRNRETGVLTLRARLGRHSKTT